MGKLIQKEWGWAEPLLLNEHVEMSRADIVKGGYCSWHHHDHKDNMFVPVRGRLMVEVMDIFQNVIQHIMSPGDSLTIPTGVRHRFVAPFEAVLVIEVYYPTWGEKLKADDIVRYGHGGRHYDPTEE